MVTIGFSSSVMAAKSKILRVDIDLAKRTSVAMAIETYDGEFYDLSEVAGLNKYKGNVKAIKKKDIIRLKNGDELDVNEIRYLFVAKRPVVGPKRPKGISFKMPADEE